MNNYFKSQFNHPDNAQKIIKNQILGLQRVVKLSFIIDGKEIVDNFKSFKLSQSATNHHQFELVLDFDVLSNPQNHNLEDAQKFLLASQEMPTINSVPDVESRYIFVRPDIVSKARSFLEKERQEILS